MSYLEQSSLDDLSREDMNTPIDDPMIVDPDPDPQVMRERLDFLTREIPRLFFAGCRKVAGELSVMVRPLQANERELVMSLELERRELIRLLRNYQG